ncbi:MULTISPECIES: efflux RND transporter periplasmic adaptor subunit [unclassified Mesorhizobium]|uniref:efflux RND transporter periplasmic adaptor subunit n=1 Tax=unclassified Mesorhizobium TaxID=325217 RepID=UPI000F75862F|nr:MULTISPECIES: efflux RND transporter periplasmic adaptor subunit [unclassified Mesorhizobium]AZO73876.1 efflux RND transporter periplasmic adaptor subunit [Mesorhizobium sp. M1D.F.Ca.ET.043.01.1.1]RWA95357.1 MAG: efflux RND transporter periplasmic adaptor subunit [Mesorhizobium sp.]RWD67512.1 MAG: efflux RND transporter periplasmic adaptor subunit [Mesorhizobium sp.]RWE17976.1 MAG: efflux RND transporter periplasmic adaptor subunit [Mesorhizobium sp.]RWE45827.1 MAG: efflux RND transporter p
MDTRENGQLHRDAGGRPRRSAGWLARAAVSAAFLLGVAFSSVAFAQDQQPPVVTAAKPVVREIVEDDEFVGRFEAVDQVAIRSRVSGYLDKVSFQDGALVNKGDLLFTIDQRPYQAAYDAAKSQVDVAKSLLEFSKMQLDRADELAKTGNISTATVDDRRREYLSAQAQMQGATAALTTASLNMEFTEIKAPLSGRIDRRLVSVGNLVQPDSTLLTTIVTRDPIDFYFDVDERLYFSYARDAKARGGSMQEGASGLDVVVHVADRAQAVFKGKLDFAENRIDNATGTMRVRARFPNADGILQPGMFGRINVPGSLPYSGVLVPDEAIGADQDRRIVFLVDEAGTVSAKPVRTGPRLDGYRVIREGLTGDETIIVNGLMHARPGTKVKVEMVTLPPRAETAELQQ